MIRFIKNITLFLLCLVVMAEVSLRIFGLATDLPQMQLFDNGYFVFQPSQKGQCTRGLRGEISAHYQINASGWNSTIDYDIVDSATIALIGDSYIQGFYVDVDSSIGRKVEHLMGNKVVVHEFGKSGANIHDYRNIYQDLVKKGYQQIFINIGAADLMENEPGFTNRKKGRKKRKRLVNHSALKRYLTVNMNLRDLRMKAVFETEAFDKEILKSRFDSLGVMDVVYLYQDSIFNQINTNFELIPIIHSKKPFHYGFNKHWNDNGTWNVAETIVNRLKK